MGSPNNGPFSYVSGSLQLYTEALNYHIDSSPVIENNIFNSKDDFNEAITNMPSTIKFEARKFVKRTSSSYLGFTLRIHQNGLYVLQSTKPGDVPGSYAQYVKILYEDGTIRAVYKDTIDNKGKNIHRHIKWPAKEI